MVGRHGSKSGDPDICVNLTQLNRLVYREKYILPSVEQTLGSQRTSQMVQGTCFKSKTL